MILKGSQRGSAKALALHLLNEADNDHVEVHAVNGFMSDNVADAFQEIEAISRATKCKQFMFSLSLSPPEDAVLTTQDYQDAIDQAIELLGLAGQPHAVIFHEKNARRHCHLVVSRIDTDEMKAVNLPFFKERLCELSRELFLSHGWELPKGHEDRLKSDPLNYTLEEHQVAQRAKRDPKQIKAELRACWEQSDGQPGFTAALSVRGFILCQGDRRGFVAVDRDGNVYSLSRWLGVKSKELKVRLGDPKLLPDVEEALSQMEANGTDRPTADQDQGLAQLDAKIADLIRRKESLKTLQCQERFDLRDKHDASKVARVKELHAEQTGLRGLWLWATGKRQQVIDQHKAELQLLDDRAQTDMMLLSKRQRDTRRDLQNEFCQIQQFRDARLGRSSNAPETKPIRKALEPEERYIAEKVRRSPDIIIDLLIDKKSSFTQNDIWRGLSKYIQDADERRSALSVVLASSKLTVVEENPQPVFSTPEMLAAERRVTDLARKMAKTKAYGVRSGHLKSAIQTQNRELKAVVGAKLSEEQRRAIAHVVNRRQLSAVIGLAGAGKSTMLNAARDAWERQGYRVIGAALAGKAADGLQSASSIPSRTLASYELSWKNGRNLLQPGDVLVIDEAGMIGTHQMARFIEEANKRRAKIVLVGDPDQLQPINAGTPFRDMTDKVGYAELSEIHRQKSEWQKQASLDLARGRTDKAIVAYDDHGAVRTEATREEVVAALVEDYMIDYELNGDSASRLAIAHRREDVRQINNGIRAARRSAGELDGSVTFKTDNGERQFAAGDRILFTRNDVTFGVKNGSLGTVCSATPQNILVSIDDARSDIRKTTVKIDIRRYSALDYGYATTIHKAQGVTVDNSFVLATQTMDDHLRYVALTRHTTLCRQYRLGSGPINLVDAVTAA